MTEQALRKQKRWLPLESNPQTLNTLLKKLGFPTSKYDCQDVYSTEDWAIEMVPQPVAAVIFLYPLKEDNADEEVYTQIDPIPSELFYMKQTIGNACGTIAVLHAVANMPEKVNFDPNSFLNNFLSKAADKSASEIGKLLEESDELEQVHASTASQGQSEQLNTVNDDINTHFICFSNINDRLYELDGRKDGAVDHGTTTKETFLKDACAVIKGFMARDPSEIRFTIIALAKVA